MKKMQGLPFDEMFLKIRKESLAGSTEKTKGGPLVSFTSDEKQVVDLARKHI